METSAFWNVQLPTNLKPLIESVHEHRDKMKQFRDSESDASLLIHQIKCDTVQQLVFNELHKNILYVHYNMFSVF